MKKVISKAVQEKSEYFSDFSGKSLGSGDVPIELKIDFNYGSIFDGSRLELHLTDEENMEILEFIAKKLHTKTVNNIKQKIKYLESLTEDSISNRSWDESSIYMSNIQLYHHLLNYKNS